MTCTSLFQKVRKDRQLFRDLQFLSKQRICSLKPTASKLLLLKKLKSRSAYQSRRSHPPGKAQSGGMIASQGQLNQSTCHHREGSKLLKQQSQLKPSQACLLEGLLLQHHPLTVLKGFSVSCQPPPPLTLLLQLRVRLPHARGISQHL